MRRVGPGRSQVIELLTQGAALGGCQLALLLHQQLDELGVFREEAKVGADGHRNPLQRIVNALDGVLDPLAHHPHDPIGSMITSMRTVLYRTQNQAC